MTRRSVVTGIGLSAMVFYVLIPAFGAQAPPATRCDPSSPLPAISRCFELRTYAVDPNRSGVGSPSTIVRKEIEILKKSGAEVIGVWQGLGQPATLVYMLAFRDGAHRESVWSVLNADPEWALLRTSSMVPQATRVVFMSPTDYSPVIGNPVGPGGLPSAGRGAGQGDGGGTRGSAYIVGGGVSAPRILSQSVPEYSQDARDARVTGMVDVQIIVKEDGAVEFTRITKSLGYGLDQKAIDAVRKWRFEPGKKDGKPVRVILTVQVSFSLP